MRAEKKDNWSPTPASPQPNVPGNSVTAASMPLKYPIHILSEDAPTANPMVSFVRVYRIDSFGKRFAKVA
jgi:hypothetical protein